MSIMLKELPNYLKPRERLKRYGVTSLTNEELIAILLRTGTKDISVKDLAIQVLKHLENIQDISDLTLNNLMQINGIAEAKAMSILSALELGKRVYLFSEKEDKVSIKNGYEIYAKFKYLQKTEKQENLIVVLLDNKNQLINSKTIFKGSLNISIAHPREIFKYAINHNAAFIIVVHNHPSGDPKPSASDQEFTNQIIKTGEIVGIPVIDHIIIGNNKYYTFKENKVVKI